MSLRMITPPVGEPVSVGDMYTQLGMVTPTDLSLSAAYTAKLSRAISAARRLCDTYTRSVYLTQTWLMTLDSFPWADTRYSEGDRRRYQILLPKLPFQSIDSMQYVDVSGELQTLVEDKSRGTDPDLPLYGYQLDRGSETQPSRLFSLWAKPWPPTRRVPENVQIQFKCGFGGYVTGATIAEGAAIVQGPIFTKGDVGQSVIVPGAGTATADLKTSIASVDVNGQATLAANVVTAVDPSTSLWVGKPIPESITQAILLQAEFFFTQGGDMDIPAPRAVRELLDEHRNLVA